MYQQTYHRLLQHAWVMTLSPLEHPSSLLEALCSVHRKHWKTTWEKPMPSHFFLLFLWCLDAVSGNQLSNSFISLEHTSRLLLVSLALCSVQNNLQLWKYLRSLYCNQKSRMSSTSNYSSLLTSTYLVSACHYSRMEFDMCLHSTKTWNTGWTPSMKRGGVVQVFTQTFIYVEK